MSKTTQGLVFVIASIAISKNAQGEEQQSYWGEAVCKDKSQRATFRIGANQVKALLEQLGENKVLSDLVGLNISGNLKGYGTDTEGKALPGLFVVNRYIDADGVEKTLTKPKLILGGLLNVVKNFNDMIHERLDITTLEMECDTPIDPAKAKPKAAPIPVEAHQGEEAMA